VLRAEVISLSPFSRSRGDPLGTAAGHRVAVPKVVTVRVRVGPSADGERPVGYRHERSV